MQWNAPYELRKLTVNYSRAVTGAPAQDAAMTTHHFLNLTADVPDVSWITADYTTVESAFDAFWTAIKPRYSPSVSLAQYSWRQDGPAFRPHGTSLAPNLRTIARSVAGTNTHTLMPPQVAVSVTEVTPAKFTVEDVEGSGTQSRNRWGRFYLPAPALDDASANSTCLNGRVDSAFAEAVAVAAQVMYNACVAADLIPVMYSPTTGSAWAVSDVHVDDIFDVVRSRRFVTPLSRHSKSIDAP